MLKGNSRKIHQNVHFLGLVIMIAGLPFSVFLMSLSQIVLLLNWIIEGKYREKLSRYFKNKDALMLTGIFLILLPGLFYSDNQQEALKMLRINLPFLVLPLILGSREALPAKRYKLLLYLFIGSVTLATAVCAAAGLPAWLNGEFNDVRQISLFISHIRFALLICLAILLSLHIGFRDKTTRKHLLYTAAAWMALFLLILQSLTGIVILGTIITVWAISQAWKRLSPALSITVTLIPVAIITLLVWTGLKEYRRYTQPAEFIAESYTPRGNPYSHNLSVVENGNYVGAFVSEKELEDSWNQRSEIPYDSLDRKGHHLNQTLIRYLNSKSLRKDAEGVAALSDTDVRFIEQGIANVNYTGAWGIKTRFYQTLWEFSRLEAGDMNASGSTFLLKYELFRQGIRIIADNPILGVGIGDVPDEFKKRHEEGGRISDSKWWMTSHNQYIYIAAAAGLPAMACFLYFFLFPSFKRGYTPLAFFIGIAAISMLTEDTLSTQAGVSFVAFFYCVFLFANPELKEGIK